jgi:hypothetical protein
MVDVQLWAGLKSLADGQRVVRVEASNIREMLDALVAQFPALKPIIDDGVSVAIDGDIYAESMVAPITPDSEVVLMQRIKGG